MGTSFIVLAFVVCVDTTDDSVLESFRSFDVDVNELVCRKVETLEESKFNFEKMIGFS